MLEFATHCLAEAHNLVRPGKSTNLISKRKRFSMVTVLHLRCLQHSISIPNLTRRFRARYNFLPSVLHSWSIRTPRIYIIQSVHLPVLICTNAPYCTHLPKLIADNTHAAQKYYQSHAPYCLIGSILVGPFPDVHPGAAAIHLIPFVRQDRLSWENYAYIETRSSSDK